MSSLCTDAACSSDNAVAKCTASDAQECYRWLFKYESTIMTQHGCAAKGFTSTALRDYGAMESSSTQAAESPMLSPTTSSSFSGATGTSTAAKPQKKQSLAPIIGGTIGGCTILSLVALSAFLIHRRRRAARSLHPHPPASSPHNAPEFHPNGFPTSAWAAQQDSKTWQTGAGGNNPLTSAGQPYLGIAEVHGHDRAVEVEAPEKTKTGHWVAPGIAPVEVEAPTPGAGEKRRWWRGSPVVEAPT